MKIGLIDVDGHNLGKTELRDLNFGSRLHIS